MTALLEGIGTYSLKFICFKSAVMKFAKLATVSLKTQLKLCRFSFVMNVFNCCALHNLIVKVCI